MLTYFDLTICKSETSRLHRSTSSCLKCSNHDIARRRCRWLLLHMLEKNWVDHFFCSTLRMHQWLGQREIGKPMETMVFYLQALSHPLGSRIHSGPPSGPLAAHLHPSAMDFLLLLVELSVCSARKCKMFPSMITKRIQDNILQCKI